MELCIKMSGEHLSVPMAHKHQVQGLLYHMLSADPEYSAFTHGQGFGADGKTFRMFVFSDLRGPYRIEHRRLYYPKGFELIVRSSETRFLSVLQTALLERKDWMFCGNPIEVESYTVRRSAVRSRSVRIRMLSPLTVYETERSGHTHYFHPNEPAFYAAVCTNAAHKWSSRMGEIPCPDFSIEPAYRRYSEKAHVVTTYKGSYINAWNGEFLLKGDVRLLNLLYQTGLGGKNGQGFGMFEVLDEEDRENGGNRI